MTLPPSVLMPARSMIPSDAESTGVPRFAKMSTPLCDRPPLRGAPQELGIRRLGTPATGIVSSEGGREVSRRARTTGCRRAGKTATPIRPVSATRASDMRQPPKRLDREPRWGRCLITPLESWSRLRIAVAEANKMRAKRASFDRLSASASVRCREVL